MYDPRYDESSYDEASEDEGPYDGANDDEDEFLYDGANDDESSRDEYPYDEARDDEDETRDDEDAALDDEPFHDQAFDDESPDNQEAVPKRKALVLGIIGSVEPHDQRKDPPTTEGAAKGPHGDARDMRQALIGDLLAALPSNLHF